MKRTKIYVCLISLLCCLLFITSCSRPQINDVKYWFSSYDTKFIAYDDEANNNEGNIDEAGTYWEMTVKSDCKITISIIVNTDMFSSCKFTVNGDTVLSEDPSSSIYSYIYKDLNLKKGDKIKLHAFWVNTTITNDEGFKITMFTINDGTGDYPIDEIK